MSTFRKQYRKLDNYETQLVEAIKTNAEALESAIKRAGWYRSDAEVARAFALAQTKLEEAVMWAVKAVTT